MKNFVSVSTNAARFQDISLNPQKLAGLCAKLKCCLNYEVDDYVEAGRKMPSRELTLFTQDNEYHFFKSDILAGTVTYSTDKKLAANLETISAQRAIEVIELNRKGEKPLSLLENGKIKEPSKPIDLLADADISRFDKSKKKKKSKNREGNRQGKPQQRGAQSQGQQPKVAPQQGQNPSQEQGQNQGQGPRQNQGQGQGQKPRQRQGRPQGGRPRARGAEHNAPNAANNAPNAANNAPNAANNAPNAANNAPSASHTPNGADQA